MQRTPDKKSSLYGSDPSLASSKEESLPRQRQVSSRLKRTRDFDFESAFDGFKDYITSLLSTWKAEQNEKFSEFRSDLASIKEQLTDVQKSNGEIEKSLTFLSSQFDALNDRVTNLEKNQNAYERKILLLEQKTEEMSRKSCMHEIELRNIPAKQKETQDQLAGIAIQIFKTISVDVSLSCIVDIQRIPSKSQNRVILVSLSSIILKNNILTAAKQYNMHNKSRLNTSCLGDQNTTNYIYIAERLTMKARRLYYLGRELVKSGQYKYCWTANGNVLLRKQEGSPLINVKDEEQVAELKNLSK